MAEMQYNKTIAKSPDGTKYEVSVDDNGIIETTLIV